MSHDVNTYIGRLAPWWALSEAGYKATVTGKMSTWAELLAHGGLDFDVFKSQLQDNLGRPVDSWGVFRWNHGDHDAWKDAATADRRAIAEKSIFLGSVGQDYNPNSHVKGFEIVDLLMANKDGAHYETAGVLGQGEVVWGLANLGESTLIGGEDEIKYFLLFATSHDGSMSNEFRIVSERVVCRNTLRIAMSEKTKAAFKIRHTKNSGQKFADAKVVLANMGTDIKKMADRLNFLAGRKLTREGLTTVLDRLFPIKAKEVNGVEIAVSSTRRDNILADILKLYEVNDGNAFPAQRGSSYNLLNAITNYVDHERSSQNNGRAESALFGSGDKLKDEAFHAIWGEAQTASALFGSTIQ